MMGTLERGEGIRVAFLDLGKGRHRAGPDLATVFPARSPRCPAKPSSQAATISP